MKRLPTPEAILFDLDDTLIDRHASLRCYAGALAQTFGDRLAVGSIANLAAFVIEVDRLYGPGEAPARLTRLLPWRYVPAAADEIEACWQTHFPESVQATDGMETVLAWIREHHLRTAIVTNGETVWQMRKIERLGLLPLVDRVVVSETVGIRKPDPRIFTFALAELGTAPHLTWFVGDDLAKDIGGATAAGMVSIWFRRREAQQAEPLEPDAEIGHLRELLPLVDLALS